MNSPTLPHMKTVTEICAELAVFTPEQRSLAWMPEPAKQSYPSDCRVGGSCGLDFNHETLHARWVQARFRWLKGQRG